MLKKVFLLLLFTTIYVQNFAQSHPVFTISEDLKKEANAVVRYDNTEVIITSQNNMKIIEKYAITIFNEEALYFAHSYLGYDPQTKINSVSLEYFDAFGNSIKKVKRSDFTDRAAVNDISLYTDDRILFYEYTPVNYPFTVVSNVEKTTSNTAFLPRWLPIPYYNIGVESSIYKITYPKDLKLNYIDKNFDSFKVEKSFTDNTLLFSLKNVQTIKREELSPAYTEITPYLRLALNKFNLAGYNGTAESWSAFGKWMEETLLVPRNNLSQETKNKINDLVSGTKDPKEKARIIYEYVQDKTRYINVSIGIGGWMPMTSNDVDKLSYGDCKALTFYTKSLLDAAGVTAYYSIVHADSDRSIDIEEDLVSIQGNHVFLMLPFEKDSVFLECTSKKLPFGINGDFTHDRNIVTLTPEGGKVIRTTKKKPHENLQKTIGTLSLNQSGVIHVDINIKSYGNQLDNRLGYDGLQPHQMDKLYKDYFKSINNIKFETLNNKNNKPEKVFEENFVFNAENYAVVNSDGSIIFSPNALNRLTYVPQKESNRTTNFETNHNIKDVDEVEIILPVGYELKEVPALVLIETEFGKYKIEVSKKSENTITYKRDIELYSGNFDKTKYEDYRKFRRDIKKNDELKVLLTKK